MHDLHELPRVYQAFPRSQRPIIDALIARGYNLDAIGVCFGLTQMLIAEALTDNGGLEKYLQRLARIFYFAQVYGSIENYIALQEKIKLHARLKKDVTTVTLINENLLDIQAFFDGVALYQAPQRYSTLFADDEAEMQTQLNQSTYPAKKLLTPVNMENRGQTVAASSPFIALYTRDSFAAFIDKTKAHFNNTPFCIEINSIDHQSTLVFDPEIGRIVFVDSNTYELTWKKSDLIEQVFCTLIHYDTNLLSLRVCVNSKYNESLDDFCAKETAPSIQDTMPDLNGEEEISWLVNYHMKTGNIAAIDAILAYIEHINPVQKSNIILDMANIALGYDFSPVLPTLLQVVMKPEEFGTPTEPKNPTNYIESMYATCLSVGAVKCARFFLERYPTLLKNPSAFIFASENSRSLELLLKKYAGNREEEKTVLFFKPQRGYDALFLSASNSTAFAILLKKCLTLPEFFTERLPGIGCVSLLEQLIRHPSSLVLFLEAAASNKALKKAVFYAMDLVMTNGADYMGTIFHQALAYPASFRALLAFSAQQNRHSEHAHLQSSVKYGIPYFTPRPGSVLPTFATRLIELFLTDRQMMRFILEHYPLKQQLALLSLEIRQDNHDILLFEADCFSERFKRTVRAFLQFKDETISKRTRLSLANMYKEDKAVVPQEFVCLFENALSDPEKFKALISSIPEKELDERVRFSIDGLPSLWMRSLSSPVCFKLLIERASSLIGIELLMTCLKRPQYLNFLLETISPEKLFSLISEQFHPVSFMSEHANTFPAIWQKLHTQPATSDQAYRFFGGKPKKDEDTVVSKMKGPGTGNLY